VLPADPGSLPRWPLYRAVLRGYRHLRRLSRLSLEQYLEWEQAALQRVHRKREPAAILEKAELRGQIESWLATSPQGSWVVPSTSGSTGEPLRLPMAIDEYGFGLAAVLHGFRINGLHLTDRVAHLCVPTTHVRRSLHEWFGLLSARKFDLRRPLHETWQQLEQFQPQLLYGYPSHLQLLADAVPARRAWRPRIVVSNGELLTPRARQEISLSFGTRVFDSYGAVELPRIAVECPAGRLHVTRGVAQVEVDPRTVDETGAGDLLLTSLHPRLFPLWRYRIGDRGVLESSAICLCGQRDTILRQLQGRVDDQLRLPSGRRLSPRAISLLEMFPWVKQFQIVQGQLHQLDILIRCDGALTDERCRHVLDLIRQGLDEPQMAIQVKAVDQIPIAASGKRRAVISRHES
jgi:phenylacetate-CoA ligase